MSPYPGFEGGFRSRREPRAVQVHPLPFAFSVGLLALAVVGANASLRVSEYRDYVDTATAELPEGSFQRDTIIFLCSPNDWKRVMKDVPPPKWLQEPPGTVLLVGPFRHDFSCQSIQLRGNDNGPVVTLGGPSESAPPALGGCAIAVGRTIREEPIVIDGFWGWKQKLATVHACNETIKIPETDYADLLRVRLHAGADRTGKTRPLQGTKVQLIGPNSIYNNTTIAGIDGMAIFKQVPATTDYEVVVDPTDCRRFNVWHQEIRAGRDVDLDVDLGALATLAVRVTTGQRPIYGASVRVSSTYQSYLGSAETDRRGKAVVNCLPAGAKVDLRVTRAGYFWKDRCGVMVDRQGRSQIVVVLEQDPNPRRRPIPPVCDGARTQQSSEPTHH